MHSQAIFLLRKIQLHPGASFLIASLIVSIVSYESYSSLNQRKAEARTTSRTALVSAKTINTLSISSGQGTVPEKIHVITIDSEWPDNTQQSINHIDGELAYLLKNRQFSELRKRLLQAASVAVSNNDDNRLGYILNLLGQVSIQEQDIHSAKVYLEESKNIFQKLQDKVGVAQVNLQLGRTHLTSRQIARTAGIAYDELQVGRWYLANGLYGTAEKYITESIQRNLSISRYGSAASAYESLTKLYLKQNEIDKAQNALFESARMFASSGKIIRARKLIKDYPSLQQDSVLLAQLNLDIQTNYASYREDILQIERAKDYRRLFRFYRSSGDQERAWRFRLLANESLASVSKRSLFHRQQGVLAILYNSNDAKQLAENYFVQAKQTFDSNGMLELSSETVLLNQQVF